MAAAKRMTNKITFAAVNQIKYLPRSDASSREIYLKLIKLAIEAIIVPRPPRLVPIINAR